MRAGNRETVTLRAGVRVPITDHPGLGEKKELWVQKTVGTYALKIWGSKVGKRSEKRNVTFGTTGDNIIVDIYLLFTPDRFHIPA